MARRPPKIPTTPKIRDETAWEAVKKTVTPLKHRPRAVEPPPGLPKDDCVNPRHPVRRHETAIPHGPAKAQTGVSRAMARKLASGQKTIEMTLDLHGLTRRNVEDHLIQRLGAAHQRGLKCVLLITGKGGRRFAQSGEKAIEDRRREEFSLERGTLRTLVPELLSRPPLSHYVASFCPSAACHGGDGALYVLLRRKEGRT